MTLPCRAVRRAFPDAPQMVALPEPGRPPGVIASPRPNPLPAD